MVNPKSKVKPSLSHPKRYFFRFFLFSFFFFEDKLNQIQLQDEDKIQSQAEDGKTREPGQKAPPTKPQHSLGQRAQITLSSLR
jgi:hypothetical protein